MSDICEECGAEIVDGACPECTERYLDRCRDAGPKLADACRAALLFFKGGAWDPKSRARWKELTGRDECTSAVLCRHIRKTLELTK